MLGFRLSAVTLSCIVSQNTILNDRFDLIGRLTYQVLYEVLLNSSSADSPSRTREPCALRAAESSQWQTCHVCIMKFDAGGDTDVANSVSIRDPEGWILLDVGSALNSAYGHRFISHVNKRHPPRLGTAMVNFHAVLRNAECDVGGVQKIV